MTITEVENSIITDLKELGDALMRTEFLLRCGKAFPGIPEEERSNVDLVKDCQAKTWLHVEWDGDVLRMKTDSESLIVKGALALLDEMFNGRTGQELSGFSCALTSEPCFTELFNTKQRRGLLSMVAEITKTGPAV